MSVSARTPLGKEPPTESEQEQLAAARDGDEAAFERLLSPHIAPLRSYLLRMIGHPADAEDVMQETLLKAHQKLASFGRRSSFRTWLFAIATRNALDLLRKRKRWPEDAQIQGEQMALGSPEVMQRIGDAIASAEHHYDYRQHVAYCFSCVARSMDPEQSAALMLKELLLFENGAAAEAMNLSESTFRHRLSAARKEMIRRYEGLCALIGKEGVCYQCAALRDICPSDKQGIAPEPIAAEEAPAETKLNRRLKVVRETDLGASEVHGVLLRFMTDLWDRPTTLGRAHT